MEEKKKKDEGYDVDEALCHEYLEIRDTGIIDAILDHVEKKYSPAARALTEITSSRYLTSMSLQLKHLQQAMKDPEVAKQLRKKYGVNEGGK